MSNEINVPVVDRATGKEVTVPGPSVIDWATGEEIVLADATTDRLGEVIENCRKLRASLMEAEIFVSNELVDRLDRNASWTYRGEGGLKISAPSPEKGSEDFPIDALESALRDLLERKVVSHEGAAKAMKRQITLTVDVPLEAPLKPLEDKFADWSIELGGLHLPVVNVSGTAVKVAAGVKALRKIPAAAETLDRAAVKTEPPLRKAKVERA